MKRLLFLAFLPVSLVSCVSCPTSASGSNTNSTGSKMKIKIGNSTFASCSVKPMVNQVLAHISNTPIELIQYNKDKDILVEAYSRFGHGELFKNEEVAAIGEKYKASVSQLAICYCLQLDLLPLPKTVNPAHMKANADVEFVIAKEDMAFLKNIQPIEDYGEHSKFPVYGKK